MLRGLSQSAFRSARVSLARRWQQISARADQFGGGAFADREKALENKAIYEHERKLIADLKSDFKARQEI